MCEKKCEWARQWESKEERERETERDWESKGECEKMSESELSNERVTLISHIVVLPSFNNNTTTTMCITI